MTDRKTLYDGISHAAWGYLFLYLDINLGTVSLLLRGIPFIYQGQEIGMENCRWESVGEFNDVNTIDQYQVARQAGLSE